MSNEDAELLRSCKAASDPVNQVLQFESLRAQGWTNNDLPHWDMRRWEYSETKNVFVVILKCPMS